MVLLRFCLGYIVNIRKFVSRQSHLLRSSGNAVLSASKRAFVILFHFVAVSALLLKNRLSLSSSMTGLLHALNAGEIFVIARMMSTIVSSTSSGLHSILVLCNKRKVKHRT